MVAPTMRSSRALGLSLSLALLTISCKPSAERVASEARARARAQAAATELATNLRQALQSAMQTGGPAAAIEVCATRAPAIAQEAGARHRARVGRSSHKLRNTSNTAPDWVGLWLDRQASGPAAGAQGVSEVSGSTARFLRPIAIEAVCLTCHGAPAGMPAPLRDALAARYPNDRATGYAVGDLRGALWAEADVE
jgi:FtsP/CotA-like multicopper oxidase with cupredoxin domain